jgi:hypothetical protein
MASVDTRAIEGEIDRIRSLKQQRQQNQRRENPNSYRKRPHFADARPRLWARAAAPGSQARPARDNAHNHGSRPKQLAVACLADVRLRKPD